MSDWVPLRTLLAEEIAEQIDHAIRCDPDPELRQLLAAHRDRAIELATDHAELVALRQIACERCEARAPRLAYTNGSGSHRVVKVPSRL